MVEVVVVIGFDKIVVLVDGCDDEETTSNGLLFDCGTGFCITGLVVDSNLSLTDITYNTTVINYTNTP